MEVTCFSETLFGFQRTTRRYIPEDRTLSFLCILLIFFVSEIIEIKSVNLNAISVIRHGPVSCGMSHF
jgi:hypothetical protein